MSRLPFGYFWFDGKACLRQEAKETFAKIFGMRLHGKLIKEIAEAVGLKGYSIDKILGDVRVAGTTLFFPVSARLSIKRLRTPTQKRLFYAVKSDRSKGRARKRKNQITLTTRRAF